MTAGSPVPPLHVFVIADNPETIQDLRDYLQSAGVPSHATQALPDAVLVATASAAVVLFPDEFDAGDVLPWIASLRASRPLLLVVVVTSLPQRLRPALDPDGHSLLPIVLSKPAFGWAILDAIRAHASTQVSPC